MGAQLGYQWAKFKGLTVDLSIGPEYSLISILKYLATISFYEI